MYIYVSHLGGLYTLDHELSYEERYCEECGDADWFVGYATNKEEAWELLKDDTSTFDESLCNSCIHSGDYDYCDNECEDYKHSGGWSYEYVMDFINENWGNENFDESHVYDDYDENFEPYEDENMKFIWGIKSYDDLSDSDANLYTMNDIDLIYLKNEHKYIFGLETIFQFEKEEYKLDYLKRCLDAFTKFMKDNGYNMKVKPSWMDVFSYGWSMNTKFDSVEDCYAMFKLLVNGYCSL